MKEKIFKKGRKSMFARRLFSTLLAVAMVVSLLPAMTLTVAAADVFAQTDMTIKIMSPGDPGYNIIAPKGAKLPQETSFSATEFAVKTFTELTNDNISTSLIRNEENSGWYVVKGKVGNGTQTITLGNSANVNLILANDAELNVNQIKGSSGSLTIWQTVPEEGKAVGALTVTASDGKQAINVKNLTINGGTIAANGGKSTTSGSVGIFATDVIIINGGTVTANGGKGGKFDGNGIFATEITINGGTVTANGSTGISTATLNIDEGLTVMAGDAAPGDKQTKGTYDWDYLLGQKKYAHIFFPHAHEFSYTVPTSAPNTIVATCANSDGKCELVGCKATLTLTAGNANYSGISGLSEFNTATGKTISTSDVEIYKVDDADTTTGGTKVTGTPSEDGYYYASLTVEGQTAVKAFTIGHPSWPTAIHSGCSHSGAGHIWLTGNTYTLTGGSTAYVEGKKFNSNGTTVELYDGVSAGAVAADKFGQGPNGWYYNDGFNWNQCPSHTHVFAYNASGSTLTATCSAANCSISGDTKSVSLTLTASSANYSGISGLSDFNKATGKNIAESGVEIYKVDAADTTTGGTKVTGTTLEDGYYYAALTVEGQKAVKAFTIGTPGATGNPGGDSGNDPDPEPSGNDNNNNDGGREPEPQRDPNEVRGEQEETFSFAPVSTDAYTYSAASMTEIPTSSYNLSRVYTTRGIIKGLQVAIDGAMANNRDNVEVFSSLPLCFTNSVIQTIRSGGKPVVFYFVHENYLYSVTVPATFDTALLYDANGFAGPLYVGQQLGTTKLIKQISVK